MTGTTYIKGLAFQSPLTISNTSGSSYLLLGTETSSASSKANASVVNTKRQVDNVFSSKANQSNTCTKTEIANAFSDMLSQLTGGELAKPLSAPIATGLSNHEVKVIQQRF